MLTLLESEETKGYVDSAIKSAIPALVQCGLGSAVPFLSPLIVAAASNLLGKGLKLAGDKIEIAYEQLQPYKEDKGVKSFVARMVSPCIHVLKKVFPASERELYEALSDSGRLKQFLNVILNDPDKRKDFEQELKKFLTGAYGNFEEFQKNVKDTLGVDSDRMAIETYTH